MSTTRPSGPLAPFALIASSVVVDMVIVIALASGGATGVFGLFTPAVAVPVWVAMVTMTALAARFSESRSALIAATVVLSVAASRYLITTLIFSYLLLYSFSPGYVTATSYITLAVWAAQAASVVIVAMSVTRLRRLHHHATGQRQAFPLPRDAHT